MDNRCKRSIAFVVLAGICLICGDSSARAQEGDAGNRGAPVVVHGPATNAAENGVFAHLKRLLGTVSVEGGKITFITRVDKRTWTVMNPETLGDLEGQNVQIIGQLHRDSNSIYVVRVRTFRRGEGAPPQN
jgi:hypothetical protein